MNKLEIRGSLWIASDIHLGPAAPATAAAFERFLDQAARQAQTLILVGDLFDAWIGDDVAIRRPEPWLESAISQLQAAAKRVPLWIGRGNRDFLMGPTLMRHIGAQLLPESVVLDTDAGEILLSHGDEYCWADQNYQRFRRLVRRRNIQSIYLALPLTARKRIAAWARARSMDSNQYKDVEIMDVTPTAIVDALRRSQTDMLIHGHTHRPARHQLSVDGRPCERLVIPDWDFDHSKTPRGGWIEINAEGVQLVQYRQGQFQPTT